MRKILLVASAVALLAAATTHAAVQDEAAIQQARFQTKCAAWAQENKVAKDKVEAYVAQCVATLTDSYKSGSADGW